MSETLAQEVIDSAQRREQLRRSGETLFLEHYNALIRFAYSRVQSFEGAADAVQGAFERLLRQDSPPSIEYLRAYVYKTVARLCLDAIKLRKNHGRIERGSQVYQALYQWQENNIPAPEDEAANQQLRDRLNEGVAGLPPRCRMAFTLVELQGISIPDCAIQMKVKEMAIYHLINRSYAHLGKMIVPQTLETKNG